MQPMLFLVTYKQHIYFLLPFLIILCITYCLTVFLITLPCSPPLRISLYFLPRLSDASVPWTPLKKKLLNHLIWFYILSVKTALPARFQILKLPALTTTSCIFHLHTGNTKDASPDSGCQHVQKFLYHCRNVPIAALLCFCWSCLIWYCKIWRKH